MRSTLLALALVAAGCGDSTSSNIDMSMGDDMDLPDLSGADFAGDLSGPQPPSCPTNCSEGAKSCDGNGVRSCVKKGNCTDWSAPVPCGGGGVCSGGVCAGTCKDQCDQGATYCSQNGFRTCAVGLSGCTDWTATVTACQNGSVCSGGVCADRCVDRCSVGQSICSGFGTQHCERKFSGCLDWSDPFPCDTGKVCSMGVCVGSCTDACTAGTAQCNGSDAISTCEKLPATGCNEFSLPQLCQSGVCSMNACQTCTDLTKRCSPQGNVEQCMTGVFTQIEACAFGCNMGQCTTMVTCNPGEQRCNGNQVEVCNSTGTAFLFSTTCSSGCSMGLCQGTCTDGALRCNGKDVEKCMGGSFVKQMTCTTFCDSGQCALDSLDVATTTDLNGLVIVKGAVTVDGTGNLTSTMGNLTIRADTIRVTGTITISPTGTTPDGKPADGTSLQFCGGTGGAYAQSTSGCSSKSAWGTQFDSDVQPGSPGGAGGTEFAPAGAGGKGGGVVRLIANSITIDTTGKILADGATGGSVTASSACGGGGGSGGGILLAADSITSTGILSVAGGTGGTSTSGNAGNPGSPGRIKILHGSTVMVDTSGSKLTPGAFDPAVGTATDKALIPPLTITSSTHPNQTLFYNDGAPSLGLTWEHPFGSAMGFYQLLNTTAPASLSTSNLPQPSNAGNLVRADLISLDPRNLSSGATPNFFHIVSVNSTAVVGQVDSHYTINVNSTPPNVTSSSHPNQQSFVNIHDVFWSWTMPGPASADNNYTGVYYIVDQFGDTIPTTAGTFVPIGTKQIIKNLPTDGVFAIHMVSSDTMGYLTKTAKHYAVRIGMPTTLAGSISGTVFNNMSQAVSGATITVNRGILDLGGSTPTPIMSDTQGKFGISMLPSGTWEVEATAPGFKTGTAMATITDTTAQVVTITLQPSM
jgi:Carboxypeptidase regulatory-like domain